MPKRKQPSSLRDTAMHVLVGFLTMFCDRLSVGNSLDGLRRLVAAFKKDMAPHIPWQLSADFYMRFMMELEDIQKQRKEPTPDTHQRAILEIIMDIKIIGLRCTGFILTYLHPDDAHRIRGLKLLDLSSFHRKNSMPVRLENFHLQDLATFKYPLNCTDADLEIIGQNCPMLVFLDVSRSKKVTDQGISHLIRYSELRFVIIAACTVTYTGITKLLSVLRKIEKLAAWSNNQGTDVAYGFDCFSHLELETIYPSINDFTIVLDRVSDENLSSVAAKFPNLTSLGISGPLAGDLMLLKSLSKLSELNFNSASGFSWHNFNEFLPLMGGNITDLRLPYVYIPQSRLNFIFEICPNIERLEFHFEPPLQGEKLVIPPFKKLKILKCCFRNAFSYRNIFANVNNVEFVEMPELQDIRIGTFYISKNIIKSMIMDHKTFLKLKSLSVFGIPNCNSFDEMRQVAKDNNLIFEIVEYLL